MTDTHLLREALRHYGLEVSPEDEARAAEQLRAVLRRLEPLERVETQEPPADLRWVEFACAPPSGLASTVEWLANAPPQLPE
ncbi:MAG: hypothetical protein QN143_07830, partial [Armatimonadota bacterium]|nr:hypothetical protein [Armatimonadota bacterium]